MLNDLMDGRSDALISLAQSLKTAFSDSSGGTPNMSPSYIQKEEKNVQKAIDNLLQAAERLEKAIDKAEDAGEL